MEKVNKWTRSSMIVTHPGKNTWNIKAEIGFEQIKNEIPSFYSLYGKTCQETELTHSRGTDTFYKIFPTG